MSNTDKLLIICLFGVFIGFIITLIDVQKHAYQKGVRDGYHRGRALNRQEFWEE